MSILQEDTILNLYVLNIRVSKYVKQKVIGLQEEVDELTNYIWRFQHPFLRNGQIQQTKYQ